MGGETFHSPRNPSPPSSCTMGTESLFQRVKRSERVVEHPPPFSAEVKERVVQHLYSQSGPSLSVLLWQWCYYRCASLRRLTIELSILHWWFISLDVSDTILHFQVCYRVGRWMQYSKFFRVKVRTVRKLLSTSWPLWHYTNPYKLTRKRQAPGSNIRGK